MTVLADRLFATVGVSPRAGGEAAKFGERYEGRWTVGQLLRVLAGQATSLLV